MLDENWNDIFILREISICTERSEKMKALKKCIAIVLCVLTVLSCFAIIGSAKEDGTSEVWVELVCDTDQEIIFNVPYKLVTPDTPVVVARYLVQTNGKPIEECFSVTPQPKDEIYYAFGGFEYLGFCIYDKEDECYYAQFRIVEPDLRTTFRDYGLSLGVKALIAYPFMKIGKAIDLKLNYKSYGYAEEHKNR